MSKSTTVPTKKGRSIAAVTVEDIFAHMDRGISSAYSESYGAEAVRLEPIAAAAEKMQPAMVRLARAIDMGTGSVRFWRPDGTIVSIRIGP